jgi:CDGSH-type Zn-finger protein
MGDIMSEQTIKIVKNGPYLVSGKIPLNEKIITLVGENREYAEGKNFEIAESYALCRCGKTSTPPFCDGTHAKVGFDGTEIADRAPFDERVEYFEGPTLRLADDNRCAFARFCHRAGAEVWTLTEAADCDAVRDEAIKAANDCPAGRLVQHDKLDGNKELEFELEPSIWILQDPERNCSAPLFVRGNIPLVSADGTEYELRNRYALCRCGESNNKPFCDATHVNTAYQDGL